MSSVGGGVGWCMGWNRFVMWGECVVWDSVLWMGGMGACMEKACEVGRCWFGLSCKIGWVGCERWGACSTGWVRGMGLVSGGKWWCGHPVR